MIQPIGKHQLPDLTTELQVMIKNEYHEKIFSLGNKINVSYYGKRLIYKILDVKVSDDFSEKFENMNISGNDTQNTKLYKAAYSTKWIIAQNTTDKTEIKKKKRHILECVGGYSELIADLKDVFDIGLGKYGSMKDFDVSKGILLFGPGGIGKSMIAEALLSESKYHFITISASDIYSKQLRETESTLSNLFAEALENVPCVILIEDIDTLCPRKSNSSTDHEKRMLATLVTFFDNLQDNDEAVMILATSSKPDSIDSSLRRPGRIDKEFEICVPTRKIRREIISKIIKKIPHSLSDEDVDQISYVTHGFVGADLQGLCSQASMSAIKRKMGIASDAEVRVTREDFNYALTVVNPSAMREVLADVPNVRWSDIGGQKDLKLKLIQAVEWPLKHPEAFTRLGIVPPKGLLMFGPPGCSKTMIAKALATESKLNFLNVKVNYYHYCISLIILIFLFLLPWEVINTLFHFLYVNEIILICLPLFLLFNFIVVGSQLSFNIVNVKVT